MIEQPGTSADPSGTIPAGADQEAGSLSLKEAARQLGISERTIRRRIQDGSLEGYKQATEHGYEWRVCLGSIRADPSGMPTGILPALPAVRRPLRHVPRCLPVRHRRSCVLWRWR